MTSGDTDKRVPWNEYFMEIAHLAKKRSTCLRRQVGAVIVKNNQISATGYNGAPARTNHCLDLKCLREQLGIPSGEKHEICRGAHAELNAIVQAAKTGISIDDAVIYCTNHPCAYCAKAIINAGIKKVFYEQYYADSLATELLQEAEVEVIQLAISSPEV